MLRTIKENKTSIIISFVIAIIIFYLQPLLAYIGTIIVNFFLAISKSFSDYLYQQVAKNDPNIISDYISSLIVILILWVASGDFIEIWQDMKELEKKIAKCEGELKGSDPSMTEKELTLEENLANIKTTMKKNNFTLKLVSSIGIVVFLSLSFKQGINSVVNSINVSFQNDLIVLSTHLSDNEIKQMRAKWVQMRSSDDYKKIRNDITEHYKKFNLTRIN